MYASRLYALPIEELQAEARKYKDEGYTMVKLRFRRFQMNGESLDGEEVTDRLLLTY